MLPKKEPPGWGCWWLLRSGLPGSVQAISQAKRGIIQYIVSGGGF